MNIENPILYKSRMIFSIRRMLSDLRFVEIQTPVLRKYPGDRDRPRLFLEDGRSLRESSAYALRVNLAITDRLYEIGPMFRPDIASNRHLPEFTMLDLYATDFDLAAAKNLALQIVSTFYHGEVRTVSFADVVLATFAIDLREDEQGEQKLCRLLAQHYSMQDASVLRLLDRYITDHIEPLSKDCCLVVTDFSPAPEVRARLTPGLACVSERFEIQINGEEVVHGYVDEPNVNALSVRAASYDALGYEDRTIIELIRNGRVPSGSAGFGIGIERLAKACLGLPSLRDLMPSWEFAE
ncbi:hypothetical protein HFO18_07485 [Rhizobium laguerreae]|nr:hypothetical protein [Rhizobium laguerreae]